MGPLWALAVSPGSEVESAPSPPCCVQEDKHESEEPAGRGTVHTTDMIDKTLIVQQGLIEPLG